MNEDESLRRYGLSPAVEDLGQVRETLEAQTEQADSDIELMRLCCVQLFNTGDLDDVLPIWRAKESSWDAHCSIDVQLLCGAGLEETKAYLATEKSEDASEALDYLLSCEATGDFLNFSVENRSRLYARYYLC
jgi:hypothetical protein